MALTNRAGQEWPGNCGGSPPRKRLCVLLAPDASAQSKFAERMAEAAESLPPDVQLIAADGSRRAAHRLVLSARSPFFLSMLSTSMREQATGEVHLPDVEPRRLEAILAWMYGRKAEVRIDDSNEALSLLELAKRWQVDELCEQLSSCEACTLSEDNVLGIWETAQRLTLERLEDRCRDYVMSKIATMLQGNAAGRLSPLLRGLSPAQFRQLLDSDELPVTNEEEALELALLFIQERTDNADADGSDRESSGTLTPEEVDEVLLAVRWRLVPGPLIAERAMRHPALLDGGKPSVRPRLLFALADGMQFQFLGGKAWSMMEPSRAASLRRDHRIHVKSYASLAPGMMVRVVNDVDQLRQLCKRCAPGAKLKVEWVAEMKALVGVNCTVKELRDEICGVQIEDPSEHVDRYLPFDALLLGHAHPRREGPGS